ncbi:MAG TPA: hypothetical protein PLB02_11615, partial [Thermoanaerobaculia bacterium]|nr:hypothetical protein [Thermoanaerobaculia bacterium]
RFAAGARPEAPRAEVPPPRSVDVATLAVPCWSCEEARTAWPISFRTDLDVLAPLGTGRANAAIWLKDFAKPNGSRLSEWTAALERRIDGPAALGKVLPPDDPLLREAEPWCDQATMRFYPEIFELKAWDTQVPNLILPLTLARSWAARGEVEKDPEKALADFRRAIRLGRLLRQEGTVVITDLVGLACVRIGAEGIYARAAKSGDPRLMLLAALVIGEAAPQKLLTSERLTRTDLGPYLRTDKDGKTVLEMPDRKLDDLIDVAKSSPDVRFRGEALLEMNLVRFLGTPGQKEKSRAVLGRTAAEGPWPLARLAAWSRDTVPTREFLEEITKPAPGR